MKKTIFTEILLLFCFGVGLEMTIRYLYTFYRIGYYHNYFFILNLISTFALLIAIILIALKDFPVFKPLLEKLHTKKTALSENRAQAKAARAEENKQARIEKLEAELNALKKDE